MSIGPYARRALTFSKLLGGIMVSTRRSTRAVSTTAVVANSQAGPSRPNKKLKVEPSFTEEKFPGMIASRELYAPFSRQSVQRNPKPSVCWTTKAHRQSPRNREYQKRNAHSKEKRSTDQTFCRELRGYGKLERTYPLQVVSRTPS